MGVLHGDYPWRITVPDIKPLSVTVPVASHLTGVCKSRIWEWIRDKRVDAFMLDGRRVIDYGSLERIVEGAKNASKVAS
jgi:hypothetical protein